jgi:adenosylcobinamide-GDP ribazoletransferase
MTRAFRAFRLAMAFLTVIPIPVREDEATPSRLADARFAYPIVGGLIGLALAGLSEALRVIGAPAGPSSFLLMASAAILSGGLHLDGLADTADGLFLWGDPGRRLAVMRDPHLGSFGVSAVVVVLIGKFAAIEAMAGPSRSYAVMGGATVARSLVLVSAGLAPYARPEGTGRFLVQATNRRDAALAAVVALIVGTMTAGRGGVIASAVGLSVAIVLTRAARRKLGGVTGDTLGALVELGELSFLLIVGLQSGEY